MKQFVYLLTHVLLSIINIISNSDYQKMHLLKIKQIINYYLHYKMLINK